MGSQTAEDSHPAPTFQGRLKLENFMFNAGTTSPAPRRSPRLFRTTSGTGVMSAPPSPSPASASRTPTNNKRKALLPPAADDDNTNKSTPLPSPSPSRRSRSSTNTPTPLKKKRTTTTPSSYAPPSTYAHLPGIPDALAPNLLILLIGLNPGIETARSGHAYAHPTNLFWRLLFSSGITPRLVHPSEDRSMPTQYSLGLTNIVARPSRNGAELSKAEMDAGVAILEAKVRRWRPEVVCVVGKSIWESVWRVRHGRGIKAAEFRYGWQEEGENMGQLLDGKEREDEREDEREEGVVYDPGWKGARIFVAASTSGLAATLKPKEKEEIWKELGDWTVKRRAERAAAAAAAAPVTPDGDVVASTAAGETD